MGSIGRVTAIVLLVLAGGMSGAMARVWTDAWGRKYEGNLIKVSKAGARLEVNGVLRVIPFKNFSSADIAYLRGQDGGGHMKRVATREELKSGAAVRLRGDFKPKKTQMQVNLGLEVKVIESDPAKGRWVYRSPHFEFVSNAYLGTEVVREFSWMFEVTHDYLATLPVQLQRLREAGTRPMRTYLFSTFDEYVKAGGPPTSAGAYIPAKDVILIPFKSLGLTNRGGGYALDDRISNRILLHEIAHHLMRGRTQQAAWFIEGVAEYVACIPFAQNRLLLSQHQFSVTECVVSDGWQNMGGYRLGQTIELPRLQTFMGGSYRGFQETRNAYPSALILFYYFARMDGAGDGARLKEYAEILLEGHPEAEARQSLLAGRSFEALEKDLAKAWGKRGVVVTFK
jgi:hypothetical protein